MTLSKILILICVCSCATTPPEGRRVNGTTAAESKTTAVLNVGIPDLNTAQNSAALKFVNAFRIQVFDETCTNTNISNDVAKYVSGFVTFNLKRGCSYRVNLFLGTTDPNTPKLLKAVYYQNVNPVRVTSSVLGDDPANVTVPVDLTDAGRSANLPKLSQQNNSTPIPNSTPTPGYTAPPNPTPPPQSNLAQVFSQISLVDGQQKSSTLADHFQGQYLLIDFSASSCGNCVDFAQSLEGDSQFQSIVSQGKCSAVTLVSKNDFSSWTSLTRQYGIKDSGHTYGAVSGIFDVGDRFRIDVSGIPAVGIVDPSGKTVSSGNQEQLDRFKQLCR